MTDLLEALMILCFGLSWPISIRKSLVSRTAKGKSVFFEVFIWIGYVFGIARKCILFSQATGPLGWLFYLAWFFYVLNILEISVDIGLYVRNSRLDAARG
ncbi:MAG: hypothetical protein LUE87_05435 [Lachnospiraceae bacterium]|nr:hypothetical protein [Lachnospiraceae bacterium]